MITITTVARKSSKSVPKNAEVKTFELTEQTDEECGEDSTEDASIRLYRRAREIR
ncbi:hypothetical protein MD484_g2251, partial [Candolleomyces efflorescens]